jgi:hypothetical protein
MPNTKKHATTTTSRRKRITANDVLLWLLNEHIEMNAEGYVYAQCAADKGTSARLAKIAEETSRTQYGRSKVLLEAVCAIRGKGPVAAKAHAAALRWMLGRPESQWSEAARKCAASFIIQEMPRDLLDIPDHDGPICDHPMDVNTFRRIHRLFPFDQREDSTVVALPAPIAA